MYPLVISFKSLIKVWCALSLQPPLCVYAHLVYPDLRLGHSWRIRTVFASLVQLNTTMGHYINDNWYDEPVFNAGFGQYVLF